MAGSNAPSAPTPRSFTRSELPFLVSQGQQLWFCCNTIVRRGWNANLSDGVPDSQERQAVCADCPLSARWHVRTSQSETAG